MGFGWCRKKTRPIRRCLWKCERSARGIAFSRCDLLAFVANPWPLIAEDSDPAASAREFIEAGQINRNACVG